MSVRKKKKPFNAFLFVVLLGAGTASIYRYYFVQISNLDTLRPIVSKYSEQYDVEQALVMAVIRAESSGRPKVVSKAGAVGLMQLMPATAEMIAGDLDEPPPTKESLMDPVLNIRYGTYYLSLLMKQFGSGEEVILAAYNAGPTCVQRWLSANQDKSATEIVINCPFRQTRVYIRRACKFLAEEREYYSEREEEGTEDLAG